MRKPKPLTGKKMKTVHSFIAESFIDVVVHKKNEDKMPKACVREGVEYENGIIRVVSVRMYGETTTFSNR